MGATLQKTLRMLSSVSLSLVCVTHSLTNSLTHSLTLTLSPYHSLSLSIIQMGHILPESATHALGGARAQLRRTRHRRSPRERTEFHAREQPRTRQRGRQGRAVAYSGCGCGAALWRDRRGPRGWASEVRADGRQCLAH